MAEHEIMGYAVQYVFDCSIWLRFAEVIVETKLLSF